jgi:hypothetical protein
MLIQFKFEHILKIEHFWPFEEISIFSNSGHLEWRAGLSDTILLCKLEKRGDEIKKKSSPLKLLSQSQPNFAEIILGWPPSKIVSVDLNFQPRFKIAGWVDLDMPHIFAV